MKKILIRKEILHLSDILETASKQLKGAAEKIDPINSVTLIDCEIQNWRNVRPCFVLSTGRSGTLLLTKLLQRSPNAYVVHHPSPELVRSSKRAYEEILEKPEVFRETFKSAREEMLLKATQRSKVYIETNNRITFFAPIIPDIFPNAIFIHLVRHPADFVISGIRRNWYSGMNEHDIGRINPIEKTMVLQWEKFSKIQKISWLWNETNSFIESFIKTISKDKYLFIKLEDLSTDINKLEMIYDFIKLTGFNRKKFSKLIHKPQNVQKKGKFPQYELWTKEEQELMCRLVPLAEKYGYSL